jgi:nucleotide-binding universal stress UspA family protein
MKIKPAQNFGVVVELGPNKQAFPVWDMSPSPVLQFRRILAPIDFSEASLKALQYAALLAQRLPAELVLLHVVKPSPAYAELPLINMGAIERARGELETLKLNKAATVRSNAVVREGYPHTEILKAADELGVDLIVMSTHGRTGLAHALLGSTSEKVVRYAECPVLVLPERDHGLEQQFPTKTSRPL